MGAINPHAQTPAQRRLAGRPAAAAAQLALTKTDESQVSSAVVSTSAISLKAVSDTL